MKSVMICPPFQSVTTCYSPAIIYTTDLREKSNVKVTTQTSTALLIYFLLSLTYYTYHTTHALGDCNRYLHNFHFLMSSLDNWIKLDTCCGSASHMYPFLHTCTNTACLVQIHHNEMLPNASWSTQTASCCYERHVRTIATQRLPRSGTGSGSSC